MTTSISSKALADRQTQYLWNREESTQKKSDILLQDQEHRVSPKPEIRTYGRPLVIIE